MAPLPWDTKRVKRVPTSMAMRSWGRAMSMEKAPSSVGCSIVCLSTVQKIRTSNRVHDRAAETKSTARRCAQLCALPMLVQFVGWSVSHAWPPKDCHLANSM